MSKSRSKNLKARILCAVTDTVDLLGALELLVLKVFAFVALLYLLVRAILYTN